MNPTVQSGPLTGGCYIVLRDLVGREETATIQPLSSVRGLQVATLHLLAFQFSSFCNNPNPDPFLGNLTKAGNPVSAPSSMPHRRGSGAIPNTVPQLTTPVETNILQLSGHSDAKPDTATLQNKYFEQGRGAVGEEVLFAPVLSRREVVTVKTGLRRLGSRAQRKLTSSGVR